MLHTEKEDWRFVTNERIFMCEDALSGGGTSEFRNRHHLSQSVCSLCKVQVCTERGSGRKLVRGSCLEFMRDGVCPHAVLVKHYGVHEHANIQVEGSRATPTERKRDAVWWSQTKLLRRISHYCEKSKSKVMKLVSPPLRAKCDLLEQIVDVVKSKTADHEKEKSKSCNTNLKKKWKCSVKQSTLCLRLALDIHMEVNKIFLGKELRNRSKEPTTAEVGLIDMLQKIEVELGLIGRTHLETHSAARPNNPRAPTNSFPSQ